MKARVNLPSKEDKPAIEIIDRETYKKIKAYSREEMSEFLVNLCAEKIRPDYSRLRARIGAVKGIGETRLDMIMAVIEDFFEIS